MRLLFCMLCTALIVMVSPAYAVDDESFFDHFNTINKQRWYISSGWSNGDYQACEWRAEAISLHQNLQITLSDKGGKVRPIGCGEIHTMKKTSYGTYEARMRTAAGSGLNSNLFTYIGPSNGVPEHDEIDFEFLGKDPKTVQINYWRNGDGNHAKTLQLGYDASKEFHNYAFEWTPEKIRWFIDGKLVSETPQGAEMPHNSSLFYLSLWAGSKEEDAWLGPFSYTSPVTAEVAWASYTPMGQKCLFPDSVTCKQ